jgi:hypothetical protein
VLCAKLLSVNFYLHLALGAGFHIFLSTACCAQPAARSNDPVLQACAAAVRYDIFWLHRLLADCAAAVVLQGQHEQAVEYFTLWLHALTDHASLAC